MVMFFPSTADKSWRYQTTNARYGEFYGSIIREVQKDNDRHSDCDRRVAQLSEELHEAKACLEMVNLGGTMANQWHHGPRGPCCFEATAQGKPCECRQKEPGRKNPYNLNSLEAWNCGQKAEPEFLEDHIKCYHPRLAVKQFTPKITFGTPNRSGQQQSGAYGGGGGGFGIGLDPRPYRSSPSTARGGHGSSQQNAKINVLPATSRYGFYRYYGYAGQGAKTSKGFHPRA